MKRVPILVMFTEGAVIHQLICRARAAILVLDSDLDGVEDDEIARVDMSDDQTGVFTNYQVKIMMDDDISTIGGDESITFDEVMARARAEVDKWMGERTT